MLTGIALSCVHVTVICNKEAVLMRLVEVALWVQILEEAGFAEHGRIAVTQPRRVVCAMQLSTDYKFTIRMGTNTCCCVINQ